MPTPRWVGGCAVVNNILYAMGGANNTTALTVVESYNPATNTWSTLPAMPTATDSVNATVENNIIYVIGGYNQSTGRLATVQAFNPATSTWSVVTPLKVGKSEPGIGLLGSTIVAAGGLANSGQTGDNEGYNAATGTWQSLTPVPAPWYNGCSGAIGGVLYLAGGQNNGVSAAVQSYSLQTNSWTTGLAAMPNATVVHGSAVVGSALYCFGGSNNSAPLGGAIYNYVQIYQPPAAPPPSISSGGVVSASAFGEFTSVSPGSWLEIYGANLAADTRGWTTADFTGINAPTNLDGTTVTIGGQPAFIDYISPTQINALVPSNVGTGPQQLVLTTAAGTSAPYNITVNAAEPGLLATSSFNVGGIQYVVAFHADGTYVLPVGAVSGLTSRPAAPGEVITLYGVGFGPVTPNIPAGQLVQQLNSLSLPLQMEIGGMPASFDYDGLAPNYTGLYQLNVTVPNVSADNALPLSFNLGGVKGTQTLYIAVN
jgi:uncharacterized protein (TIGR03437 family)